MIENMRMWMVSQKHGIRGYCRAQNGEKQSKRMQAYRNYAGKMKGEKL